MSRKHRKQARKMQRRERALDKFYAQKDPLGVDTRDFGKAVRQMLDNVRTGRTRAAIEAEIAAFEKRLGS
jgi:hypothetical protein